MNYWDTMKYMEHSLRKRKTHENDDFLNVVNIWRVLKETQPTFGQQRAEISNFGNFDQSSKIAKNVLNVLANTLSILPKILSFEWYTIARISWMLKMLQNEYLVAKVGWYPSEKEPSKIAISYVKIS